MAGDGGGAGKRRAMSNDAVNGRRRTKTDDGVLFYGVHRSGARLRSNPIASLFQVGYF